MRKYVEGEEMFLANYADVLTDAPLDQMVDAFKASDAAAALLAVPPQPAFHCLEMGEDDRVSAVRTLQEMPVRENGGYFVLRPEVIDLIPEGGDLIADAITPLAAQGQVMGYAYDGFWHPADTLKERTALEAAYQSRHPSVDALGRAVATLQSPPHLGGARSARGEIRPACECVGRARHRRTCASVTKRCRCTADHRGAARRPGCGRGR